MIRRTARALLRLHRWISLALAIFWLVQAVTGVLILFHWEMRDVARGTYHAATDLEAIGRRLDRLAPPGSGARVHSVWTSAGLPDRYIVFASGPADIERPAVRIAGDGTVLGIGEDRTGRAFDLLVGLHHGLLAGEAGEWTVGVSGGVLLANLLLALRLAWPPRGGWHRAIRPARTTARGPRLWSWHRAVGLWGVLPALIVVATGVALRFPDGAARIAGVPPPALVPVAPTGAPAIGFAAAVRAAQVRLPGATLTAIEMPTDRDAAYRIRLRAPGELRRAYGTSTVVIAAATGRVVAALPAAQAPASRTVIDALYPIHLGEAGGLIGRWLVLAVGLWLIAMIVFGTLLWRARRPSR